MRRDGRFGGGVDSVAAQDSRAHSSLYFCLLWTMRAAIVKFPCLGVAGSAVKCNCARNGGAVSLRRKCAKCREQRCRSHCRCARDGQLLGRARARPGASAKAQAKAKAKAKAVAAPVRPLPPAAPVGRPSGVTADVLDVDDWFAGLLADVRGADEVMVASFTYDHKQLTDMFLHRLGGRAPFTLCVLVDKEAFEQGTAPRERARLRALRDADAEIWMCRGVRQRGRMHIKAVVVDRRIGYVGSANLTEKSLSNAELCFRTRGAPVAATLRRMANVKSKGTLWDGA